MCDRQVRLQGGEGYLRRHGRSRQRQDALASRVGRSTRFARAPKHYFLSFFTAFLIARLGSQNVEDRSQRIHQRQLYSSETARYYDYQTGLSRLDRTTRTGTGMMRLRHSYASERLLTLLRAQDDSGYRETEQRDLHKAENRTETIRGRISGMLLEPCSSDA